MRRLKKEDTTTINREALKRILKVRKKRQIDIAEFLGINIDYFRRCLQYGEIKEYYLIQIAEYLDINPNYLKGKLDISFDYELYQKFIQTSQNTVKRYAAINNTLHLIRSPHDPFCCLNENEKKQLENNFYLNRDFYSFKTYFVDTYNFNKIGSEILEVASYNAPLPFKSDIDKENFSFLFSEIIKQISFSIIKNISITGNNIKIISDETKKDFYLEDLLQTIFYDKDGQERGIIDNLEDMLNVVCSDFLKRFTERCCEDFIINNSDNNKAMDFLLNHSHTSNIIDVKQVIKELETNTDKQSKEKKKNNPLTKRKRDI